MDTLDLKYEKERVAALFTEENYKKIYKYFHDKAKLMSMDEGAALFHISHSIRNKPFFEECQALMHK